MVLKKWIFGGSLVAARKVLLISVAGLGWSLFERHRFEREIARLAKEGSALPFSPSFPAVTCTVQASLTTGVGATQHGIVGNGWYERERIRVSFWDQSDRLVGGERLWTALRRSRPEAKTAILFWQNSLGSDNDIILTPGPIHKHHGGMIQDCYSKPADLYPRLKDRLGPFRLFWYWGPFASAKSTRWIALATQEVLREYAPDLVLTYLPHLDYNQQRFGPRSAETAKDLTLLDQWAAALWTEASKLGYDVLLTSDYGITEVGEVIFPNRRLREAGLLQVRRVRKMEYLDFSESLAFAVTDHQVAHLYARPDAIHGAYEALSSLPGVDRVLGREEMCSLEIDHPRSGDLIVIAKPDAWFDYRWWTDPKTAPEYASHVDIHNKPGYDPCELFWSWFPPLHVPAVPEKIRGSHGRPSSQLAGLTSLGAEKAVLLSSFPLDGVAEPLTDRSLRDVVLSRLAPAAERVPVRFP